MTDVLAASPYQDDESLSGDMSEGYGNTDEQQRDPVHVLHALRQNINALNLAANMDKGELTKIGERVSREAEIDDDSREQWRLRTQKGMEMALQESKAKTFPWPNAANIKAPLMTVSAMQFAARAYPAIIAGNDVVKAQITGQDPNGAKRARADRVAAHMSWQCLTEMREWEPQVDAMLHALPIIGCAFKKTYWDGTLGRSRSDYCSAFDVIVNMAAPSLDVAPRITHEFPLYPFQIEERFNTGQFIRFDYGVPNATDEDKRPNRQADPQDEDAPHLFQEQHRRLDLDDDGYAEPYIVTIHKETQEVCRITAGYDEDGIIVDQASGTLVAVEMKQYFTKIPFLPNPDGGFYDIGFAWLLGPLNRAVDTLINQIIDAGTLANTGGGFIGSQLRLKGGTIRFNPGEYKEVDVPGGIVRDNIVTLTFPGPSEVLFKMLGMLIEMGREVASVKDVLTGEQPAANTPATTTLALIEQGLKVFTAIYKRIHRGMKEEFGKLYALNRKHFDPMMYAAFTDIPEVSKDDYSGDPIDIIPVSDPSMVSDMQRLARAEFLQRYIGMPGINPMAIVKRQWEAAGIADIDELMAPPPPGPPPEILAKMAQLTATVDNLNSQAERNRAQAALMLAQADAAVGDAKLAYLEAAVKTLSAHNDAMQAQTPAPAPADGGAAPAGPKGIVSPLVLFGGAQGGAGAPPAPGAGQ